MASGPPLLLRILASSATAAARAGKIIRDVREKGDLGLVEKSKNDFQTLADRSAEKCIVATLTQKFPHLKVIGEEGESLRDVQNDWIVNDEDQEILSVKCPQQYEKVSIEDIVVWVDPLDGTNEYKRGCIEYVTVLIGVAIKGKPIGGIIHVPYYKDPKDEKRMGRTVWGIVGHGVGGEIKFHQPPIKAGLIVITTRAHFTKTVVQCIEALNPDQIVKAGGAGCKMLRLAEGQAHVFVYPNQGCMKWDTCAPEAVLTAIGGKVTDVNGKHYTYFKDEVLMNRGGVFASRNQGDHDELVSKMPEEVKRVLV